MRSDWSMRAVSARPRAFATPVAHAPPDDGQRPRRREHGREPGQQPSSAGSPRRSSGRTADSRARPRPGPRSTGGSWRRRQQASAPPPASTIPRDQIDRLRRRHALSHRPRQLPWAAPEVSTRAEAIRAPVDHLRTDWTAALRPATKLFRASEGGRSRQWRPSRPAPPGLPHGRVVRRDGCETVGRRWPDHLGAAAVAPHVGSDRARTGLLLGGGPGRGVLAHRRARTQNASGAGIMR